MPGPAPPPRRARWVHPFALRRFGAGLTADVFVTRWGLLTRELHVVPYARLQSVRVVQGPVQRLLRLATVYGDTAGGRSGAARDRDLGEAWLMAQELSTRAGLARAGTPQATADTRAPGGSAAREAPPAGPGAGTPVAPSPAAGPVPAQDDKYWRRPSRS